MTDWGLVWEYGKPELNRHRVFPPIHRLFCMYLTECLQEKLEARPESWESLPLRQACWIGRWAAVGSTKPSVILKQLEDEQLLPSNPQDKDEDPLQLTEGRRKPMPRTEWGPGSLLEEITEGTSHRPPTFQSLIRGFPTPYSFFPILSDMKTLLFP